MQKYRLHVLGVPHTRTLTLHSSCAITQKVYLFCKMMHARGHIIYHYGTEGSAPDCTENIPVVPELTWKRVYGCADITGDMPFDENDDVYQAFRTNAIEEIGRRKQPNDIILPFWGVAHKAICDAHPDLITIEPGIGYIGSFADIRVYESYGWMDCQLGSTDHPKWYHTVIPPFFDLDEFTGNIPFSERIKDPYFVFIGRVNESKGVAVAIDVCRRLGVKLKIAGHKYPPFDTMEFPENVEYVGSVGVEERKELLSRAIGTFMPSMYAEPFGYVQVESMLSGTPVITPDWGSFPETNINGVSGYRCRTFGDFVKAAVSCLEGRIDLNMCRSHGERYSFDAIAPKYEKFFQDVQNIYGHDGWYEIRPETAARIKKLQESGIFTKGRI